jgi:sensor c-di-GMP phosphodiesterase-like protein
VRAVIWQGLRQAGIDKTKTPTREVSINISPRQFNDTDVAQTLPRALERHAVDPCLVEVELTESSGDQRDSAGPAPARSRRDPGLSDFEADAAGGVTAGGAQCRAAGGVERQSESAY